MAEGKKSFIAYSDWDGMFKALPDDIAGKLIKHIFSYVNDQNPESDDFIINALFEQIKATLKRDLAKWDNQREQRSEAGKKSAELRALNKSNDRSIPLNETQRKPTVSVSVSVSDSVNEKDINKILNSFLLSEIKISNDNQFLEFGNDRISITEKEKKYFKTAVWFQKLFIKNLKEKNSPTTHQEKANFKNYVNPVRLMFENDKVSEEQIKQAYDYLNSLEGEFWKKNILSTETLRKKISQLLIQKNTPHANQSTNNTKKQAKFTIAGAEKTLIADAERRQRKMDANNS